MSANRLFLVCKHHPSFDQAICLGERDHWAIAYDAPISLEGTRLDAFFRKHSTCGGGNTCDHFQLALHRPADHDKPVQNVAQAVKLTLIKNAVEQEVLKGVDDVEILD